MTLFILPPAIETYSHLQKTSYIFTIVYEIDTHLFLFSQTTRKFATFKKQKKGGGASRKTPPPEFGADLLSRPSGSTIGAGGLNFSVRDGKRWVPAAVGAFSLLAGGFPPGGCDCHEPGTNERRSRGPYGQLVPLGFAVAGFAPAAYRRRRLRRP